MSKTKISHTAQFEAPPITAKKRVTISLLDGGNWDGKWESTTGEPITVTEFNLIQRFMRVSWREHLRTFRLTGAVDHVKV